MYKRILAIGDIHGEYDKLVDLYEKIQFNPAEDLLVFLGDYIDRGPEPLKVLDWLMERDGAPNIVMLRGNHEQMMLDHYVEDKEVQAEWGWLVPECNYGRNWLDNYGEVTHRCLAEKEKTCSPDEFSNYRRACLDFLGNLPLCRRVEVRGRTYIFSHAGIRPGVPLERQDPVDLLAIREEFYGVNPDTGQPNYQDSPVVTAGHTQVDRIRGELGLKPLRRPIIRDNMILVDTGAGKGGPLSCVDVLSGQVRQSYAIGCKRILAIGDIHGQYDKLLNLYDKIGFNPRDDLLVFLGDYVEHGPKPLEVMRWMLNMRKNCPRIVMLRGNHEQMMLDYYRNKDDRKAKGRRAPVPERDYGDLWFDYGGDATQRALDELADGMPGMARRLREKWLSLVGDMPLSFQVEAGGRTFFFCHAGIDPDKPLDEQDPNDLLWGAGSGYTGEATIVAGHNARPAPVVTEKLIEVDTGAAEGGPISCVNVLSGEVRQSD